VTLLAIPWASTPNGKGKVTCNRFPGQTHQIIANAHTPITARNSHPSSGPESRLQTRGLLRTSRLIATLAASHFTDKDGKKSSHFARVIADGKGSCRAPNEVAALGTTRQKIEDAGTSRSRRSLPPGDRLARSKHSPAADLVRCSPRLIRKENPPMAKRLTTEPPWKLGENVCGGRQCR